MATGYNIILPNGSVERTKASSYEQRLSICEQLIQKWQTYCYNNWMSVNADSPYSPQNKVKMFLSSLGYFLLTGECDDDNRIITRYKDVMNGKRQIPVSSCPDYIEDEMYGMIHSGGPQTQFSKSQSMAFDEYVRCIDENAERKYKRRPSKKRIKHSSSQNRISVATNNRSREIIRAVVNTDGQFIFESNKYQIDLTHVKQYAPKIINDEQSLYDMDCIMCAKSDDGLIEFYDQDYFPIDSTFVWKC